MSAEIQKNHNFDAIYVAKAYNDIAPHFSQTRSYLWPGVIDFYDLIPKNSFIADIGCGNGKNIDNSYTKEKNLTCFGCDITQYFLDVCKNDNKSVIKANNLYLPFKDNFFDAVLSVAVIHHFSNHEDRIKSIQEIFRITKSNGIFLIQIWAQEQETDSKKLFKHGDNLVPWSLRNPKNKQMELASVDRYYYIFNKISFYNILQEALADKSYEIFKYFYQKGNWVAFIKKF